MKKMNKGLLPSLFLLISMIFLGMIPTTSASANTVIITPGNTFSEQTGCATNCKVDFTSNETVYVFLLTDSQYAAWDKVSPQPPSVVTSLKGLSGGFDFVLEKDGHWLIVSNINGTLAAQVNINITWTEAEGCAGGGIPGFALVAVVSGILIAVIAYLKKKQLPELIRPII